MFAYCVTKSVSTPGLPSTRPIYENAHRGAAGQGRQKEMCLRFADMERRLGEIDRARAIIGPRVAVPATRARARSSGPSGRRSRCSTATRTRSRRCCAINRCAAQAKTGVSPPPSSLLRQRHGSTDVSFIAAAAVARGQQAAESRGRGPRSTTRSTRWRRSRGPRAVPGFAAASRLGPEGGKKEAEKAAGALVNPDAI